MKYSVLAIALISMTVLANCGGGEGAGNASCRSTYQRYLDCGVFDGGFEGTCHSQLETQYARCVADCVAVASCGDLEDFICNDNANSCLHQCEVADFECANGRNVDAIATPASCGRDPEAEAPWRIVA